MGFETGINPTSKIGKDCPSGLPTSCQFRVAEPIEVGGRGYAATDSTPARSHRSRRRRIDTTPGIVQVPLHGSSTPSSPSAVPRG
jgi:hypothetical protein